MRIDFDQYYISELNTAKPGLFFELLDNNRSRLEDFFAGMLSKATSLNKTIQYCKEIDARIANKEYFPFIIFDQEDDAYIGLIDVKNIDLSIPKAEIGYFIDGRYEGKGIITKALGLLTEELVQKFQFKKLLCRADARNKGSVRVALKNGFELEGTIRRDYKTIRNEVVDLNYYGRVFD